MLRYDKKPSNSDLYGRIKALPMTAAERRIVLSAMRDGEAVADAILWVASGIKQLFEGAALKPGLKH